MKKSLIALAVLAASGAAMAQSSVTLYGIVDNAVTHIKGKDSVSGLAHSGNATSRLGFRGVEDLGNGLKAEFVLEGAVLSDDGGTGFDFKRQSTVGLSGDFGQVRLGRALTASYNAVSRYDLFGTVGIGSTLSWSGQTAYQVRSSNMISYISPKVAGFGVGVDYGFGEKTENRNGRNVGIGATYDNGPLSLGLGYDRQNNVAATGLLLKESDLKTWQLGGSYNFGVAKLLAFYKKTKNTDVATNNSRDLKSYNLGVSVPVGAAGEVKAAYNNYKLSDNAGKANQFSLGYVHSLSKRTAVYGTYAYLKNKDGGTFALNGGNIATSAGLKDSGKQQGIQVGIRHAF